MDLNLGGRKALITGASKGIGRAIAKQLAEEGCDLYLAARTESELQELQDELPTAHGISVEIFALGLSVSANLQILADACDDADILINNAGGIPNGTIEEVDEARWRATWDLKVFGYINLTRHFYTNPRCADCSAGWSGRPPSRWIWCWPGLGGDADIRPEPSVVIINAASNFWHHMCDCSTRLC